MSAPEVRTCLRWPATGLPCGYRAGTPSDDREMLEVWHLECLAAAFGDPNELDHEDKVALDVGRKVFAFIDEPYAPFGTFPVLDRGNGLWEVTVCKIDPERRRREAQEAPPVRKVTAAYFPPEVMFDCRRCGAGNSLEPDPRPGVVWCNDSSCPLLPALRATFPSSQPLAGEGG